MTRTDMIKKLQNQQLDLLIIGGGITGAGILLDAQVRDIRSGLIEMQDFASGTSSRSTKLVHGGLRYLKQFEIKLVSEVGKERAIVYENAPHVTQPEWMLLPLIEGGTFGKFSTSIGLALYDFLAGVKKSERRVMLSKARTLEKEPLLRSDGLKGGGYYVEYKTDDARLTLEVIKAATTKGALAANYTKAEHFLYENGKIVGVHATDMLTGEGFDIYAKEIVNATGPWADDLRKADSSLQGKRLFHAKGVHIVIDQSRFPLKQAVYFDVPDGRMIFAIPRGKKTYIGTTDTEYKGDLLDLKITEEEERYLLDAVNSMFPSVHLKVEDIETNWAGVRPLIYEEGKSASEISRKDEVFESPTGLITMTGGKLTGYRKMAEKVVDIVCRRLGNPATCTTDKVTLSGGDFGGSDKFPSFVEIQISKGVELGLSKDEAEKLIRLYGTNIQYVYHILRSQQEKLHASGLSAEVFASLVYSLEYEMVQTPLDYLLRRTGAMLFDIDWALRWKDPVIRYMKETFGWNDRTVEAYRSQIEKELKNMTPLLAS